VPVELLAVEASSAASPLQEASSAASRPLHPRLGLQSSRLALMRVQELALALQQAMVLEKPDPTRESRSAGEQLEVRVYLHPARLRTKKWALHLKQVRPLQEASRPVQATLFRGPANTSPVPMLEMDYRLLRLLRQPAESIRPRPFARLSPRAH
jgi:hypothetical protein